MDERDVFLEIVNSCNEDNRAKHRKMLMQLLQGRCDDPEACKFMDQTLRNAGPHICR